MIELLVVIAIIGILSAIVLVGMRGATSEAKDARIIADMNQTRSTAEIYYSKNGNYTNLCSDADITTLKNDIESSDVGGSDYVCASDADAYCVEVKLNSGKYWCVDSALRSKRYDASPGCAAGNLKCE